VTQGLGLAYSLLLTVILAHFAGPEALGVYGLALGLVGIVSSLADFGSNVVLTREVARDASNREALLTSALAFASTISVPASVLMVLVVAAILKLTHDFAALLIVFVLVQALRNLRAIVYGYLRGSWKFDKISAFEAVGLPPTLLAAAIVLRLGYGVFGLGATLIGFEAAQFAALMIYVKSRCGPIRLAGSAGFWRMLIVSGFPLALTTFGNSVNLRLDIVLLGLLATHAEAGVYNAAFSAYLAAAIALQAVGTGFFPSLASLHDEQPGGFGQFLGMSSALMAKGSIIIAVLLAIGAEPAVRLVFGSEFGRAVLPLRILAAGVPFVTLRHFCGLGLTSMGLQRLGLYATVSGVVAHIAASVVLIPLYGSVGAAVATVASETIVTLSSMWLIVRAVRRVSAGASIAAAAVL
jgi:O-antigen/teichoic acid export membrane protein